MCVYYKTCFDSPVGRILLVCSQDALKGLWLEGQKYFLHGLEGELVEKEDHPVLQQTVAWLQRYFAGERPEPGELPLAPEGSAFRQIVWKLLCQIPYGEVTTYGALGRQAAKLLGRKSMSAQAIGGAVGHNPISVIIPCHRVLGADGSLTGYAGGLEAKQWLLEHEAQKR